MRKTTGHRWHNLQQVQSDLKGKYDDLKKRLNNLAVAEPSNAIMLSSLSPLSDAALVDMLVSVGLSEEDARAHIKNVRSGMKGLK